MLRNRVTTSTPQPQEACPQPKSESTGRHDPPDRRARTNVVHASGNPTVVAIPGDNPLDSLFSDSGSEDGEVRRVQVSDAGSKSQCVVVEIEGVPAKGIIDT